MLKLFRRKRYAYRKTNLRVGFEDAVAHYSETPTGGRLLIKIEGQPSLFLANEDVNELRRLIK